MNLKPINPTEPVFVFICHSCERYFNSTAPGAMADLDGTPFEAYYCASCASAFEGMPATALAPQANPDPRTCVRCGRRTEALELCPVPWRGRRVLHIYGPEQPHPASTAAARNDRGILTRALNDLYR